MADLSAEAPLAPSEEWNEFSDFQQAVEFNNGNDNGNTTNNSSPPPRNKALDNVKKMESSSTNNMADHFGETSSSLSTSLEDLVNTFDDKITKCFRDLDQNVESLAPIQIRNQDDIINESQMWWTLTGNYGNILPIDWSKSMTRRLHLPTLQLHDRQKPSQEVDTLSDEDEAVASDLDLHALIVAHNPPDLEIEPLQSAEEVIKEIDDLMQAFSHSFDPSSPEMSENMHQSPDTPECAMPYRLSNAIQQEKLETWSVGQLNELLSELEWRVQHHSETLIAELALRDELEYEKELKNTFISLLLNVQNKRRQMTANQKKPTTNATTPTGKNGNKIASGFTSQPDCKYITTVIPYHPGNGPPSNPTVQVLIKILRAIVEDSPTVPTLLTDYILKGAFISYFFVLLVLNLNF
uniref:Fasciculation and elongation protein zeta-2 n=1 Tax=Daphnia galeata TaxID=27404 RepID=A0A8J2RR63_9CRUS|nr:unnamed protein product [Daphnia galeata]